MANALSILLTAKDEASAVIERVDKRVDDLNKKPSGGGGGSAGGGGGGTTVLGTGGGGLKGALKAGAAGLIAMVGIDTVNDAVQGLKDHAAAAREDAAATATLDQQLSTTLPNYATYRDAILGLVDDMGDLGFADDDVREAISNLAAQTDDATAVLSLMQGAADLARASGTELPQAAEAVGKAAGGSTTALKRMGIDAVPSIVGVRDALGEVRGAAQAWAQTSQGELAVAQLRAKERWEQTGESVQPAVDWYETMRAKVDETGAQLVDMSINDFPTASAAYGPLGGIVNGLANSYNALGSAVSWVQSLFGGGGVDVPSDGPGGSATGFASGGQIQPNSWAMVGERGPELIRSGSHPLTVYPNSSLSSGGGDIVVNVDGEALFRIIDRRQGRAISMGG